MKRASGQSLFVHTKAKIKEHLNDILIRKAQAPAQLRTNWKECAEIKETRQTLEMLKVLGQMRQA